MALIPRPVRTFVRRHLAKRGYIHNWYAGLHADEFEQFHETAAQITRRHDAQTKETILRLRAKYEAPLFGEIRVYRLLELLAQCIDPTNAGLFCASQLAHTLHVMEGLERAGMTDRETLLVGLLHDLGKLALLTGEAPEHLEGAGKKAIVDHEDGIGLDQAWLTYDHGEIAYQRLKPYLPEHSLWLIRYHSISAQTYPLMDRQDLEWKARYYDAFHAIDQDYAFFRVPGVQLSRYRELLDREFPDPIVF